MSDARFITVAKGINYFAAMYWRNPEGFWEPWDKGFGYYATYEDAEKEARAWADEEQLKFKPSCGRPEEPSDFDLRR